MKSSSVPKKVGSALCWIASSLCLLKGRSRYLIHILDILEEKWDIKEDLN